mgnify:FL=1
MAKAKQSAAYVVISPTSLAYNGKTAETGDIVTDLPGESLSWLLEERLIAPCEAPTPAVEDTEVEGEDK